VEDGEGPPKTNSFEQQSLLFCTNEIQDPLTQEKNPVLLGKQSGFIRRPFDVEGEGVHLKPIALRSNPCPSVRRKSKIPLSKNVTLSS